MLPQLPHETKSVSCTYELNPRFYGFWVIDLFVISLSLIS